MPARRGGFASARSGPRITVSASRPKSTHGDLYPFTPRSIRRRSGVPRRPVGFLPCRPLKATRKFLAKEALRQTDTRSLGELGDILLSFTKKPSGSIGNTTLHSLPELYLLAISNASSMLSACAATLNLVEPRLTSIEIFIIRFCVVIRYPFYLGFEVVMGKE